MTVRCFWSFWLGTRAETCMRIRRIFRRKLKTAQGIRLSGAHSAQGAKESSLVVLGEAGQSDAQSHPQPGGACLWGATATCGHAFGALHRFGACKGEDRAEESGLQHGTVGFSGQGQLRCQTGPLRPEVGTEGNKEVSGAIRPEKGASDQPITRSIGKRGEADRAKKSTEKLDPEKYVLGHD